MKLRTIDVTKVQDIKIDTYMKPLVVSERVHGIWIQSLALMAKESRNVEPVALMSTQFVAANLQYEFFPNPKRTGDNWNLINP